jgi:hypothetical protein
MHINFLTNSALYITDKCFQFQVCKTLFTDTGLGLPTPSKEQSKNLTTQTKVLMKLTAIQLVKKLPTSYELKHSLLCSQEPNTGPYSEQDESSPHPDILIL